MASYFIFLHQRRKEFVESLLPALVKDDCFPLHTNLVLFAVPLPSTHGVQNKVKITSFPKSSLQCQGRSLGEAQLPPSSQPNWWAEQWRFAGVSAEREGECRMAVERAKRGDYSLTWKIVPGRTVKTGSNYSLIFWEWWGKQWTFFISTL